MAVTSDDDIGRRLQYAVFRLRKASVARNTLLVNSLLLGTKVKMFSNVFAVVTSPSAASQGVSVDGTPLYDEDEYVLLPSER